MTLQQHFNLIKEGKGNKAQFLKQARSLFPEYFNQYSDFDTATNVLKSKQIISEAAGGVVSKGYSVYDWKKILGEEVKATEKETSKEAADANRNAFQPSDMKNADNINFNEIMKGFYAELKDEKNAGKTGDEIKAMVVKNLAKDPLYYTKNGEFGIKDLGYTTEAPGLGEPKEPKGKHKSSGYGDIEKEVKVKANVQDSLGDKEAKTSMPKKVKEMPDKGVTGAEKKIKLQENTDVLDYYAETIESNKMTEDEAYTYLEDLGLPSFQINQIINYVFPLDEALYQGPSVKLGAGGSLGGRRFIPNVTVLSRDAIEAVNTKGSKRLGWGKPHIKVMKSGDGVKLLISKLLIDTIVGSERGRSKLSLSVSKMGTGITPEEMSELTGEFKKLIKVLSASGKLTQNGDYFLLDVPTKYNEKRNQYEMPLPAEVAENLTEQTLRSLIRNLIKEELVKENINKKYTHFAVRKSDNKILTGWETVSDIESLKYYAKTDLEDMDVNPKDYKILSKSYLLKNGIDPFNLDNWQKTNETQVKEEMNKNLIPHDKITYDDKGKEVKKERLFLDKKYTIKGKDLTPDEKYEYATKGISVGKNQEVKPFSGKK